MGKKLDDVFMVMEFMEHDLKGLMEDRDSSNPLFAMSEVAAHCPCMSVHASVPPLPPPSLCVTPFRCLPLFAMSEVAGPLPLHVCLFVRAVSCLSVCQLVMLVMSCRILAN